MPAVSKKIDTEKVRDLMPEYGITTIRALADEIGISRPSLSNALINGRASMKLVIGCANLVRRRTKKRIAPSHFLIQE